jgi:hypothetical protein
LIFSAVKGKCRGRIAIIVSALLLIFGLLLTLLGVVLLAKEVVEKPNAFVGVDVAYGDENDVYRIANTVSGYANLIVIGSLNVTENTAALTRVCDYLFQKGFYFIVYVGFSTSGVLPPAGPDPGFFITNLSRWGNKFLGAYMFDETGGKQLDFPQARPAPSASNNSDAALNFIIEVQKYLSLYKNDYYASPGLSLYTSDYALYWYDYLASYNVVFGEFAGDQSRQLTIALTRGAAETQGKEWGAIITLSGQEGTTLENSTQLYNDMSLAWQSGAKYIVVFDSPGPNGTTTTPHGILTTDQLNAMKNFWKSAKDCQQPKQDPAQTAYVLPQDYGYGFRGPSDTLWGLWPADTLSPKIWNDTNNLLTTYGMKLDIVYETRTGSIPINLPYKTLIFWNGTTTQGTASFSSSTT